MAGNHATFVPSWLRLHFLLVISLMAQQQIAAER